MKEITITKQEACRFLLGYQGLWPFGQFQGKAGILDFIQRVGCIQFDPLNIVGHNQELVLQARIPEFRIEMLKELLYQERRLLDGWDKNMSIYCTADWPYFRRFREVALQKLGDSTRPAVNILPQIRRDIAEKGPSSSLDLAYDQTVDWPWAPTRLARAALESMYFWGELVIHHKVHTRKVYDFANRHLPEELLSADDPNQTSEQYHDWYVLRRIGSVGLLWNKSGDAWLGISDIKSKERGAAITRLLRQGKIMAVRVEGIEHSLYMLSEHAATLNKVLQNDGVKSRAAILAPLDNLLWDRKLVKELFDFDYRWEVYKPIAERKYGYYVLPILYNHRFIARFEPGHDKKTGALIIKNWWWETGVMQTQTMRADLRNCFKEFLNFLGARELKVSPDAIEGDNLNWLTCQMP